MRRAAPVFVTVFAAVGIATFLSLVVAPEARSQAPPEDTSGESEHYHQVVDNAAAESFEAPGWRVAPATDTTFGEDYAYADPSDDAGPARFTMEIPETDHYAVFARWPGGNDVTTAARFGMDTTSGVKWDEVNQRVDADGWILIGIYEMERGRRTIQVTRSSSSEGGRLVADAVMVVGGVLVAPNGQTATAANPDELAGGEPADDGTLSAQSVETAATGRTVVKVSKKHLGTRYGNRRCRAFRQEDCSCHTKLVFKRFGYRLPDSPVKQYKMNKGKRVRKKSRLHRGDLVFFDLNGGGMNNHWKDHVGIYAGNGKIINASSVYRRVVIIPMRYLHGFEGGRRLRV